MTEIELQQIVTKIKDSSKNKVKVAIADIDGVLRGKYIHKNKFLSAIENGFGFCNVVFGWDCADVCYDNSNYTGWHSGYPDAQVQIDLSTYREVPWDHNVAFFLGEFVKADGSALEICPRQLLKKVISQGQSQGYNAKVGMEFEWFNFEETPHSLQENRYAHLHPLTPGMFGYSLLRSSYNGDYFNALMDDLEKFGIPIEGLHTETGPGVFEAAILVDDALGAGDRATLFKTSVKEIAYRFRIMPSFMAKWNPDLPGCSGHIHQSLWNLDGSKSEFYDEKDTFKMSDTFKSYLAGQMHCLPEILPMFAPNVNSFKRLVEGMWAPTKVAWAVDNRTTALRVIPGSAKSTRLETRVPGSDVNPYLAIATALGTGLFGIKKDLKLKDLPVVGNGYVAKGCVSLPNTLIEATKKMADSQVANEVLGEVFVQHFCETRIWEWKQSLKAVTDWEIKRYFEII